MISATPDPAAPVPQKVVIVAAITPKKALKDA